MSEQVSGGYVLQNCFAGKNSKLFVIFLQWFPDNIAHIWWQQLNVDNSKSAPGLWIVCHRASCEESLPPAVCVCASVMCVLCCCVFVVSASSVLKCWRCLPPQCWFSWARSSSWRKGEIPTSLQNLIPSIFQCCGNVDILKITSTFSWSTQWDRRQRWFQLFSSLWCFREEWI